MKRRKCGNKEKSAGFTKFVNMTKRVFFRKFVNKTLSEIAGTHTKAGGINGGFGDSGDYKQILRIGY
ncbi:hypothetical protein EGM68_17905 [Paenibacillus sp. M-152]|nr:hypothetical protein EGM68_17905 [Paenibacillus sp. M-152]